MHTKIRKCTACDFVKSGIEYTGPEAELCEDCEERMQFRQGLADYFDNDHKGRVRLSYLRQQEEQINLLKAMVEQTKLVFMQLGEQMKGIEAIAGENKSMAKHQEEHTKLLNGMLRKQGEHTKIFESMLEKQAAPTNDGQGDESKAFRISLKSLENAVNGLTVTLEQGKRGSP